MKHERGKSSPVFVFATMTFAMPLFVMFVSYTLVKVRLRQIVSQVDRMTIKRVDTENPSNTQYSR